MLSILMLPVLYLLLWLGPVIAMPAYPGTLLKGIFFLLIAIVLDVFGLRVRTNTARILLLSLSATVWFAGPFLYFLSESV